MHSPVLFKMLQKLPIKVAKAKLEPNKLNTSGFTLIEMLVVVIIIAVLSAIVAPGWLGFVNRQRVNKANDQVLQALQQAQQEAKKRKLSYSVSVKTENNIPQIAIYPGSTPSNWRDLGEGLGLKPGQVVIGTNLSSKNTRSGSGITYASTTAQSITFDYMGALELPLKTKTQDVQDTTLGDGLIVSVAVAKPGAPTEATGVKRCVIVKTLLGSIKTGKDSECQ